MSAEVKSPNSPDREYTLERTRNIGIAAHIDVMLYAKSSVT